MSQQGAWSELVSPIVAKCEREAWDQRAWGHHRAYAARRGADLRRELSEVESGAIEQLTKGESK